jgi:hypothetical protein
MQVSIMCTLVLDAQLVDEVLLLLHGWLAAYASLLSKLTSPHTPRPSAAAAHWLTHRLECDTEGSVDVDLAVGLHAGQDQAHQDVQDGTCGRQEVQPANRSTPASCMHLGRSRIERWVYSSCWHRLQALDLMWQVQADVQCPRRHNH